MTRSLITLIILAAACDPVAAVEETDPGTQIGGIDCENDKLFLSVEDEDGNAVAAEASVTFPGGDVASITCAATGCQLELDGPGAYTLAVDAGAAGTSSTGFALDESNEAGMLSEDCGDRPFHEITQVVTVTAGGDILTSNLGLFVYNQAGDAVESSVLVTGPSEPTYTRSCRASRCWIDLSGPGVYTLQGTDSAGETGSTSVTVDSSHIIGVNELGDDVYELEADLRLAP